MLEQEIQEAYEELEEPRCGRLINGVCYKLDSHCPGCKYPHFWDMPNYKFKTTITEIYKELDRIKTRIRKLEKMPAKSKNQQQAAGMALAALRGDIPMHKLHSAAKQMLHSMTRKQLEHLARTKRKGLPEKKKHA